MRFKEYVPLALMTESIKEPLCDRFTTIDNRLLHAVMGIKTEEDELRRAIKLNDVVNIKEEIGDMLWYLAVIADIFGLTGVIDKILHERDNDTDKLPIEGIFENRLDMFKKSMFYGKEIDGDEIVIDTIELVKKIKSWVENDAELSKIMTANINKLRARYPNNFKERDAVERDLEKERKILEENLNDTTDNNIDE
jgi:NTP pyrophosphatase (non-canonical NTP hydrolase)